MSSPVVHSRHHHVREHEVDFTLVAGDQQRVLGAVGRDDDVALHLEQAPNQRANGSLVLDEQDPSPSSFVVKKGSKIRAGVSASVPCPESLTDTAKGCPD
jgi:hypothetical protein